VRRAINRVRNLSFGGAADRGQDPRVSVAAAKIAEPQLLATFLGRVSSQGGRELEQVLSVRVTAGSELDVYLSANDWIHFADPQKAIRTTDVWSDHFAAWGSEAQTRAKAAAKEAFAPITDKFIAERTHLLQRERQNQTEWLERRTEEITGRPSATIERQRTLLPETNDADQLPKAAWETVADPAVRLAAFHSDRDQTPSARMEAEGVLRIYQQRMKDLDCLSDLRPPEIVSIGLLMLVPEGQHAT
jgi:hypothetical protein